MRMVSVSVTVSDALRVMLALLDLTAKIIIIIVNESFFYKSISNISES